MIVQTAFLLQHLEKHLNLDAGRKNITCITHVGQSAVAQQ